MRKFIKKTSLAALICAFSVMFSGCAIFRDADVLNTAPYTEYSAVESTDAAATVPESSPQTSDPYENVRITITAAGDNLIHPNIYMEAATRAQNGEEYDFKPLYSEIADKIAAADIAFINQETLMAGEGFEISGYPSFNSPQKLGEDLVALGFDVVNIANNHMLDKSAAGLSATIDFWHTQPVTLIGGYYNSDDAAQLRTVEINGVTIGFLSYAHHTNGIMLPAESELDIPYIDDERIMRELAAAEELADFIIVSVHWGEENTSVQDSEMERLAALMSENGADVILGHHSHTLLPLEWIERSDGGRTLCAYSLGNLVSAMMYPENMVAGLLNFTVESNGNGALCVGEVDFTPTVFYYGMNHFDTHIYLLENYTDEIAAGHGTQMYGYTTTREKAVSYIKRAIPSEYLPDFIN